jgi:hypothetical protein
VTVDLAEGVRALGRWRGDTSLALGLRVRGRFETRADGVDLVFEPLPDQDGADDVPARAPER